MWFGNRIVVRKKGELMNVVEYVIRRVRLLESREASTCELVAVADVEMLRGADPVFNPDPPFRKMTVGEVLDDYEPTGRIMSVIRAPI
jgi:hypothetical protein